MPLIRFFIKEWMDEGIFRKAIGKQRLGRIHFLKMAMVKLEARGNRFAHESPVDIHLIPLAQAAAILL